MRILAAGVVLVAWIFSDQSVLADDILTDTSWQRTSTVPSLAPKAQDQTWVDYDEPAQRDFEQPKTYPMD